MDFFKDWPIRCISKDQKGFPKRLLDLGKSTAKTLYYRGNWNEDIFRDCLAVVGTRKISRYGKEMVRKFMPDIVGCGFTVVSGFMYGVDTAAHKECLSVGGKTAAVLGCGLDVIYPKENRNLYEEILVSGGVMISEYEAGFEPTKWSFPQRNRIVAALANRGVMVVEAGLGSGSLITANLGKKLGRNIFAVPGNINSPVSQGTNYLIKEGVAKMVVEAADFLKISNTRQESLLEMTISGDELRIFEAIDPNGSDSDQLAEATGIPLPTLLEILTRLNMENKIEEDNGLYYRL